MFVYKMTIGMRDIDAFGVVFFARYYMLAHEAYESFMRARNVCFAELYRGQTYAIPIIHSECDYRHSLQLNEEITIELTVEEVRRRKFTIAYELKKADGTVAAHSKTVHVVVDIQKHKTIPLPPEIVQALKGAS